MASKSLGSLTLDLIAKVGGFVSGMSEAERAAAKSAKEIESSIKGIGVASYAAGSALGTFLHDGIVKLANAFPDLVKQAADFQDIAEKTGGSASGFAGLAVAAKVGGSSMEDLTSASIKLTKNLTGLDDESKAAGAALTALGIPIADFKKLSPEEQIAKVAEALGGFADGAGKTAVAVDLFGKSGASLLPTLKELYQQGGIQKILTDEQIRQADDYLDKQTRLRAELGLYASAIATQFIGPMNELTKVLIETGKQLVGVSGKATDLGGNTGVRDFAQGSAVHLLSFLERMGTVVEGMVTLGRTAQLLGTNLKLAVEVVNLPITGPINAIQTGDPLSGVKQAYANNQDAVKKLSASFQDTIDLAKGKETKKLKELFDQQNRVAADPEIARIAARSRAQQTADAKVLSYEGKPPKVPKGAAGAADDPTKKLLDNDLKGYQAQADAAKELLADRNKILDLYNSQGLISVKDYYAALQGNLDEATATQMKSYSDQLKALQDYQAKAGKDTDKADAQGKINDLLTKQAKLQRESGNAAIEMGIKQQQAMRAYQDSINEVNAKILDLEGNLGKAAEIRFDAQNRQLRQLAEASGDVFTVQQIDRLREYTKAQADINALQGKFSLAQGDLSIAEERITQARERGTMGEIEGLLASGKARQEAVTVMQQQLDKFLQIDAAARSPEQIQSIERLKLQLEGLKTTIDPLGDKINTIFGDAAGSAFSDFITGAKTAKEALKSFASSIVKTFADMASKELGKQLFGSLFGSSSGTGGAGGLGGLLSAFLGSGSGGAAVAGANAVGAAGGDSLGALIALKGWDRGGFTGMGAANDPAGIVHKGEYVLNAEQTRRIGVANLDRGNFGGSPTINVNIAESVSRNTGSQIAAEAQRKLIQGSRNT